MQEKEIEKSDGKADEDTDRHIDRQMMLLQDRDGRHRAHWRCKWGAERQLYMHTGPSIFALQFDKVQCPTAVAATKGSHRSLYTDTHICTQPSTQPNMARMLSGTEQNRTEQNRTEFPFLSSDPFIQFV